VESHGDSAEQVQGEPMITGAYGQEVKVVGFMTKNEDGYLVAYIKVKYPSGKERWHKRDELHCEDHYELGFTLAPFVADDMLKRMREEFKEQP
jgi:hypothetical protein